MLYMQPVWSDRCFPSHCTSSLKQCICMHELLTVKAVMQRYANNATSSHTKKVIEQSNNVIQHEISLQYLLSNLTIKKIAVVCNLTFFYIVSP